jgi:amino acid transporter
MILRDTLVYLAPFFTAILFIAFVVRQVFKHRKHLLYLVKKTANTIPLFITIAMITSGVLFFVLAPYAFNEDIQIKGNSTLHAYGIFLLFITFSIISYPLAKAFYKEYKDPNNKF